jgi:hypothetical protein
MMSDGERAYLIEMRGLTKDVEGRDVLVGLTFEETEFYMAHARARRSPDYRRPANHAEQVERYLALHAKYERARFQILGAEHQKRVDKPTMN